MSISLKEKCSLLIAIDGHSASGKSNLARKLSNSFHIPYLDTGRIYRLLAFLYAMDRKIDCLKSKSFPLITEEEIYHIFTIAKGLNLSDIERYNRDLDCECVARYASFLAQFSPIRDALLEKQIEFASNGFVILEGKDIGSIVLPNADFKFFITANIDVRANRRYQELKTINKDISYDEVRKLLSERDEMDEIRIHAPLRVVSDSFIIDSTNLTCEEVFEEAINIINIKNTLNNYKKKVDFVN